MLRQIDHPNAKSLVSKKEFLQAMYNDELLEHASFVENYYGTPKKYVDEQRELGNNVLLEIETVGAKQVMNRSKYDKGCISIFLTPPSLEELEARIRGRGTETEEVIQKRIKKAALELKETFRYQHVVRNDDIDLAVEKIAQILLEASNAD